MVFHGGFWGIYSRIYGDCCGSLVGLCGVFAFVSSFMNAEWEEMRVTWRLLLEYSFKGCPLGCFHRISHSNGM